MKNYFICDPVLTWGSVYPSHTRLENIRASPDDQSFQEKTIMLVMKSICFQFGSHWDKAGKNKGLSIFPFLLQL